MKPPWLQPLGLKEWIWAVFSPAFPFLAIGHLGGICQWDATLDGFLQSRSTFYEAPPGFKATGTFPGEVGCSSEQGQLSAGHDGCEVFVTETRGTHSLPPLQLSLT